MATTKPRQREWYEGDKVLYGMDGPTALGFCFKQECPKGIGWALELPMGEKFVDWLLDEHKIPELHRLLSETYEEHFKGRRRSSLSWEQFAEFVELMSNRRWQPSPSYCEGLFQQQSSGASKVDLKITAIVSEGDEVLTR